MTQDTNKQVFSNTSKWREQFSEFLKDERVENAKISAASKFGKSTYSQAENKNDKDVGDLSLLIRTLIFYFKAGDYEPSPERLRKLVLLWLLAKFEHTTEDQNFQKSLVEDLGYEENLDDLSIGDFFLKKWKEYGIRVQHNFESAISSLITASEKTPVAVPEGALPTLDLFPEAWNPLAVIVGGYAGDIHREPEHIYELFRQSQSLINLHYLLKLKLDESTEIVSDQLFVELKDIERAREILGNKNLLIVGGSLVNAVARHLILTKQLVFNFSYEEVTYLWQKNGVYDLFVNSGLFDDPSAVKVFSRMLKKPQDEIDLNDPEFRDGVDENVRKKLKKLLLEIRKNLMGGNMKADQKLITNRFTPLKMFSPLELDFRICVSDTNHEPALISVGENPWANLLRKKNKNHPRYAVIVVAGVNEMGTTQALKALSKKSNFVNRPLGGFLDITKSGNTKGLDRVTKSKYHWDTSEYQMGDLNNIVEGTLKSFPDRSRNFEFFNDRTDLEKYRDMIQQFIF